MMTFMRTTVIRDPDVEALVRRQMRERGISFKQAVNDAIRRGLTSTAPQPFRTPTYDMGRPLTRLEKAVQIAGELVNQEISRTMGLQNASPE
jgi:hypothetical protein